MLYGYELVTLASRRDDFWHSAGSFCSCLLGLRRAFRHASFAIGKSCCLFAGFRGRLVTCP
jgi:hypothetical protein